MTTALPELLPCPFCDGAAELMLEGTQPEVACTGDCGISYSIQVCDYFTYEERYNNPDFQWVNTEEHTGYGIGGQKRAVKVLTEFWNTRPSQTAPDVEALKRGVCAALFLPGWDYDDHGKGVKIVKAVIDHLAERGLLNAKPLEPIEGLELLPTEPTEYMLDKCLGKDETPHSREFIRGCYVCMARAYLDTTKRGG